MKEFSWGTFEPAFIDEIVKWIGHRNVLEVFAGNGLLARRLADKDVSIRSTTLFRSHDGHERGLHFAVEEMDAVTAVCRYGDEADILLMSWPVPEETVSASLLYWDCRKPVLFIGEVTNLERHELGGCATDSFFEMTRPTHTFASYRSKKSGLDRAEVREVQPDAHIIFERHMKLLRRDFLSPVLGGPSL